MLKDALYHIVIYPLESLLGFVLSILQGWCHSYGLSIILLSLLVNLFLLKLFFIADKASRNHALIKSKLDKKIAEFKRVFNGGELYAYIKTLYRQNHYHPIYALKALGGLALQVPFFVAVVSLLEFHSPELKGIKFGVIPDLLSPDGILWGINLLPLLMTFFTLCNVWVSSKEKGARVQGGIIALIFLVLLYKMPSALLLYWTTSMAFALIKSVCVKYIHLSKKEEKPSQEKRRSFIAKIFNACFAKYSDIPPQDYKLYRNISIFAILNLCTLVFLYNPFALYASDVSQFDPKETWNTLGALFGFFLLTSFLLVYTTSFFYKTRLLKIGAYGFCVILMIALVYNFILNYNIFEGKSYPSMDGLLFISSIPVSRMDNYADLCVGILGMLVCFFLQRLKSILRLVLVVLLLTSGYWILEILCSANYDKTFKNNDFIKKESQRPDTDILNFSQNKQNILLIISDTIQSDAFMQAIHDYPELRGVFSGFEYYPNLLSVSSITYLSVPAIIGGNFYHPINIWKRIQKNGGSFENEVLNAFRDIANSVAKRNYQVSIWAGYPANVDTLKKASHNNIEIVDALLDDYAFQKTLKDERLLKKKEKNNIGDFFSFGLFKISPYSLRTKIYVGDGWLFGSSLYQSHTYLANHAVSYLNIFQELIDNKSKENTFKIIHENSNHFPWMMDPKNGCKFIQSETEYMSNFITNKNLLVYNNHICYLEKITFLLKWMKKNNVYDNTKIIIVSDHGVRGYKVETNKIFNIRTQSSHALLLVKDFAKKGNLRIEDGFVSNENAFYEICKVFNDELQNCRIRTKSDRRYFVFSNQINFNQFVFDNIYEVKDSIYDPKNWKDVTQEFLDNLNKKEEK